jgi:peptide/nickel transport system permease protein
MSNIALPNEASDQRGNSFEVRAQSASEGARERADDTRPQPGSSARAALASEASSQRGNSFEVRAQSASEDARERADDTRPQPGSSARDSFEVRSPDTRHGSVSSARAMLRHARYILGENAVTGFAFALFLVIVLAALVGPYLVPYDPLASDTAAALKAPSAARLDFFIAVASVALVFLMGGLAGVAAGFFGGWTDRVVGRIADTIMAFPLFVLAMGIVAALGNTVQNVVLATAIVNFPLYARVARAEANVRREAGFVQAARLSGNGEFRILLAQILPNIMPIMVVQMSLTMGYAILNAAGLSFIGLGVRPPTAEWGIMVAEGAAFMVSGEWWIAFFPGAALMVAVFCFNLLGDGLRDIVDPQRRT